MTRPRTASAIRRPATVFVGAAYVIVLASLVPGDQPYYALSVLLSHAGPVASASAHVRSVPSTAGSILLELFQSPRLEVEGVNIDLNQAVRPSENVKEGKFLSRVLSEERTYWIYLPPGYEDSNESYPTLYLLHGMSQNHRWWVEVARVDRIATSMIESGKIRPSIIVMPNGNRVESDFSTTSLYDDRCKTGLDAVARVLKAVGDRLKGLMIYKVSCDADFEEHVVSEVVDEIDAEYRTDGERYAGGFSIGARGALQLALGHQDVFDGAFGLSGNYDYLRKVMRRGELSPEDGIKLFLSTGTKDQRGVYGELNTFLFHKELRRQGADHVYCKYRGAHGDRTWVAAMPHAMRYLLSPEAGDRDEWEECRGL